LSKDEGQNSKEKRKTTKIERKEKKIQKRKDKKKRRWLQMAKVIDAFSILKQFYFLDKQRN